MFILEHNLCTFNEIVEYIHKAPSTISWHLKKLREAEIAQIPYKFYEFSDIIFPYKFRNNTDYIATFESKINGDPKYQDNPLMSNFDISVGNNNTFKVTIPLSQLMIYYVTPATAGIASITMYILTSSL